MSVFHIWMTIPLLSTESSIITALTLKGYDVSAASATNDLILSNENSSIGVCALCVKQEQATVQQLYDDMLTIIENNNIEYASLIISEHSPNSVWNAGNLNNLTYRNKDKSSKKLIN